MNVYLAITLVGTFFILAFASPIRYFGFLIILYSIFKQHMTGIHIFEIKGAAVYLSDIAFLIAGLYLLIAFSRGSKPWPLSNPLKILLFLFILYGIFSMFSGILHYGPRSVAEARKNLLFLIFSLYAVVTIRNPSDLERLLRVYYHIAVAAAVTSILITFQRYAATGSLDRVFPATISILFGCGLAIGLTTRMKIPGYITLKKANISAIAILVFALVLNGHRSAWVGTAIGLTIIVLLRYGTLTIKGLFKSGFVLVIVTVVIMMASNLIFRLILPSEAVRIQERRLAFLQKDYMKDASANWRIVAWLQEYEQIKQRPLFGSGFGNALIMPLKGEWVPLPSHSGHIEVLSRQGFVGYLILLGFLWALVRGILGPKRRGSSIVSGKQLALVALIIIPFFCALFYSFEFHFWLAIGLALHFIRYQAMELKYSSKRK